MSYIDIAQPPLKVCHIARQTQDCHDFRCRRNVEAIFTHDSIGLTTHSNDNLPERAVVHVHYPLPGNRSGIQVDVARSVLQGIVNYRRKQVIGFFYSSKISGKMQINILHWNNL